ncbi:MAG: selenium cofactor biosynthesis protein YqeC [Eubacteriales bacterium]|nr:selenium cofactor biosynthesis protein YqeC [Eubacteriales bacterium]
MKRAELLERLYLRLPRVTALIGGGGKTTLLSALGETCARRGERVLLTTTTHLGWTPEAVCPDSVENLNRQLIPGRAVLAGYPDAEHHKLTGIPTAWYAQLRADRILVEADGSRRLPLKYHRTFEPVVPPDAGLVIELAGLAALGRPAGEVLHGWREAGIDPVRTVDEALCAALLERGLSAARSEAPKLVLLNQADTPALQAQGEALVRRLEERGVEAYVTQLKESHIKC